MPAPASNLVLLLAFRVGFCPAIMSVCDQTYISRDGIVQLAFRVPRSASQTCRLPHVNTSRGYRQTCCFCCASEMEWVASMPVGLSWAKLLWRAALLSSTGPMCLHTVNT